MWPPRMRGSTPREGEGGAVAIEFALVLPILLVLFVGLLDMVQIVTTIRKVSYSASFVADFVTQQTGTVTSTQIDDAIKAVELVMKPLAMTAVGVEVRGYRKSGTVTSQQWARQNANGLDCIDPTLTSVAPLTTTDGSNNDVVAAVVCARVNSFLGAYIGPVLGATQITLRRQIAMRPRQTSTIACTGC